MNMKAQGTAFKYGDNVDTDVIIPARYLNIADPQELASHAMEDIDVDFVKNVKPGDIMVAEKNFGCGSSREHAPRVIKDNGVACVIAASFARIFYRNAINIGLPILECAEAAEAIKAGDAGVNRFRHRRDSRYHHGRNVPGASLPRVHPGNHRQRRVAE